MTEQNIQNTQGAQNIQPTVTPNTAAQQPIPMTLEQQAPAQLQTAPRTAPAPEPVKLNLLAKQQKYTYTDKNGYGWDYVFQFPGIKQMQQITDNARMSTGFMSLAILYEEYLKKVIVEPVRLTIDDFNDRPGFDEVMTACDTFLGEAQE